MIIVEIGKNENLERALKTLKSKVIKTRQNQLLNAKKEFVKKSVLKRNKITKAVYVQQIRNQVE